MHITSVKRSHKKFIQIFGMGNHTMLAELSLLKPLFPIRVKVICKGKTKVGSRFQKSELIIGDEKVTNIRVN